MNRQATTGFYNPENAAGKVLLQRGLQSCTFQRTEVLEIFWRRTQKIWTDLESASHSMLGWELQILRLYQC
jgi:hypothetical protein